jgi:hypothetical protein
VSGPASQRRHPAVGWVLLLVVLVVQVRLLYAPDVQAPAPFPGADKVVHAALFGLPAVITLLGSLRPQVVLPLLALHAPVSEVVQATVLTRRTGDPWDAVADLAGMALALGLWWLVHARRDAVEGSGALID